MDVVREPNFQCAVLRPISRHLTLFNIIIERIEIIGVRTKPPVVDVQTASY